MSPPHFGRRTDGDDAHASAIRETAIISSDQPGWGTEPDPASIYRQTPKKPRRSPVKQTGQRIRSLVTRRRTLSWVLSILALLLIGAGLGRLFLPGRTVVENVVEAPALPSLEAQQQTEVRPVPDVVGLPAEIAVEVFRDAGYSVKLTRKSQPAAGAPGRVLTQDPAAGSEPASVGSRDTFVVKVASPTAMPDLRGKTVTAARQALSAHGAIGDTTPVVTGTKPPGTVLGSDPKPGATLPAQVKLQVADAGVAIPLVQLPPADGSTCTSTSTGVSVNGKVVGDSPSCSPYGIEDVEHTDYILGRHPLYFEARFGTAEAEGSGQMRIRVLDDVGAVRYERTFGSGESEQVRVPIAKVLRLRVEYRRISADDDVTAVLGDGRILGAPREMAQVVTQ